MGQKKRKKRKSLKNKLQTIKTSEFQKAVALHQNGQLQEALDIYTEILEILPEHADALYLSGVIYHQTGDDEKAIGFIQHAIKYNSSNPEYYNTLANALNNYGLSCQEEGYIEKAFDLFTRALNINPDFPLALNNIGLIYQSRNELFNAGKCYKNAIENDPLFYEAQLNLGNVFQDQSLFDDALGCYEKALELNPSSWQVYNNIGIILKLRNEFDSAKKQFFKAIQLNSDYEEAYYNLGCIFFDDNLFDDAVMYYSKCIEINPDYVHAYTNIGNVFLKKKMLVDAEHWYLKALERDPYFAEAYNNVGNLYQVQNNCNKAVDNLKKAVELAPENPAFQTNLGLAYRKFGELEKAVDCFRESVLLTPDYPEPHYNLGETYKDLARFSDAIICFQNALNRDSAFEDVYDPLSYSYQRLCSWNEADKYKRLVDKITGKAIEKGSVVKETPLNCVTRCEDPFICYKVAKSWSDRIVDMVADENKQFTWDDERKKRQKIRIAYLSNTFRDHPGGHLIAGLFGYHNRKEFEIYSYSYGVDDGSYYRKKVESESDKFIEIGYMNDSEAATRIYNDKIDILVDLRGFTMSSRMAICALRPAPIQIVYLGFPGSSGADFYDYTIADKTVVPKDHINFFSENIVYMPDCYQANNNDQLISEDIFTRKDEGLPEGSFIFCSFNTEYKIEPVMFNCWMDILKRVPDSVLWLLKTGDEMVDNLKNEAEKRGVEKNRLVFAKRLSKEKHLKRSRLADLALDTRIYNGHTTTSDALWAGLPVITMPGNHFASRVSASILKAADLSELIVENLTEYEKLAVDISLSKNKLISLKSKVKNNKEIAPLFNTPLFAENIEKAYKIMWDRFKTGRSHDIIEP